VLQVVERRHGARGGGEAAVARHVAHPLAVDPDRAVVAQRLEVRGAGADAHAKPPSRHQGVARD
jgi:hypothetical protein